MYIVEKGGKERKSHDTNVLPAVYYPLLVVHAHMAPMLLYAHLGRSGLPSGTYVVQYLSYKYNRVSCSNKGMLEM